MHDDVSTLPATTAAGYSGFSIEPAGITMSSGFRQPAFSGISSSTSVRKTYSTAATQTAGEVVRQLPMCREVDPCRTAFAFGGDADWIRRPLSSR
jgi:hypothetical protein